MKKDKKNGFGKKVVIIGDIPRESTVIIDDGKSLEMTKAIKLIASRDKNIIVLDNKHMNTFEIEGKRYKEIERPEPKNSGRGSMSHVMMNLMIPYTLASGAFHGVNSYERERPKVNIVEEFKLVQKKESKLSRSDREWVVRTFNQKYKEII